MIYNIYDENNNLKTYIKEDVLKLTGAETIDDAKLNALVDEIAASNKDPEKLKKALKDAGIEDSLVADTLVHAYEGYSIDESLPAENPLPYENVPITSIERGVGVYDDPNNHDQYENGLYTRTSTYDSNGHLLKVQGVYKYDTGDSLTEYAYDEYGNRISKIYSVDDLIQENTRWNFSSPSGLINMFSDKENTVTRKVLNNGQILILRGDKIYNINGAVLH